MSIKYELGHDGKYTGYNYGHLDNHQDLSGHEDLSEAYQHYDYQPEHQEIDHHYDLKHYEPQHHAPEHHHVDYYVSYCINNTYQLGK